ncbi:MAG: hypothetical protein CMF60_08640 [Magnetococcales bacterium]|nr:hypothetical protein [Magnetococcales bacterium]
MNLDFLNRNQLSLLVLINTAMLFVGLFNCPYEYYIILRTLTVLSAFYIFTYLGKRCSDGRLTDGKSAYLCFGFLCVSVLYSPLWEEEFSKGDWLFWNILTIAMYSYFYKKYMHKKSISETTPKQAKNSSSFSGYKGTSNQTKTLTKNLSSEVKQNSEFNLSHYDKGCEYEYNQEYDLAIESFLKSAKEGNSDAMYKLSYCFLHYKEESTLESYEWCEKAINSGNSDAVQLLERIKKFIQQEKLLAECIKSSIEGDADSQYKLAEIYLDGRKGLARDIEKAISWLRKSVKQKHPMASCILARTLNYYHRQGNLEEIANLYKSSASKNVPQAQYKLALMYYSGDGVKKNKKSFKKWLDLAIQNKYRNALSFKQLVEEAEKGIPARQYQLGKMYLDQYVHDGCGIHLENSLKPNYKDAIALISKAANQGEARAKDFLDQKKKVDELVKRADEGDKSSQYEVVSLSSRSIYLDVESQESKGWYQEIQKSIYK